MCLGGIHQHLMNDTVRSAITKMHEEIRTAVNPPAANMIKMEHNKLLQNEAQIWAERCKMTHDREDLRFLADRFNVGQNIAVTGPVLNWTEVFERWESEKTMFTYNGSNSVSTVGNYTQMIWAETFLFGCGVSKCGTNYFYVCNYAPGMNVTELSTPYISSGSWCDSCKTHCDNVTSKQCGKLKFIF
ncbi:cysteine-rich secretory protein 2-like [Mercenaria mercenaria]|uniref:cysteine-rich secretory protein 2-like n=1 Tax=Mercenaria mercenaria TaxID=6596 RepID=UPI00234F4382|nr:cysteine-rich secretory protein 2-like [Mercenaria mercenaria]